MKFEVNETITTEAVRSEVLNSLSKQFRKISKSVNQFGEYLEVRLIEASFGSINRTDISMINIRNKPNGYLLVADVSYKPSIWFWIFIIMGVFAWGIGVFIPIVFYFYQKHTVRNSIQNVFIGIKNEFQDLNNNQEPMSTINSLNQLEKLYDLKERGIISEDEFLTEKKKYLAS